MRGEWETLPSMVRSPNPTTWRLCMMNLAIRGIEANLGKEPADSFLKDQHPHEKFDLVMANPPFNMKEWGQPVLQNDKRWEYGQPPANKSILLF